MKEAIKRILSDVLSNLRSDDERKQEEIEAVSSVFELRRQFEEEAVTAYAEALEFARSRPSPC